MFEGDCVLGVEGRGEEEKSKDPQTRGPPIVIGDKLVPMDNSVLAASQFAIASWAVSHDSSFGSMKFGTAMSTSSRWGACVRRPTTLMPAARAAWMPTGESSNTMQSEVATPSSSAPRRYTSGKGLYGARPGDAVDNGCEILADAGSVENEIDVGWLGVGADGERIGF